jgi:HEPN domain-containing protein
MKDKIEIIKQWIEKGDHDLGTAQVTFLYLPDYRDTIAFHCQQAVEKYLKGFLFYHDIPFKKLHSLNYLLSLLSQLIEISDDFFDDASVLEDYSVEIRYPDTSINLLDDEIIQAFAIVKKFRIYVLNKMNLMIDYTDVKKE